MSRLLITGADGFVGRWLVRAARAEGRDVVAAIHPDATPLPEWGPSHHVTGIEVITADLQEQRGLERLAALDVSAVVHLAAIASGAAARKDPGAAFRVNTEATATLGNLFAHGTRPRFLFISSGEVYGPSYSGPIPETAPRDPGSPYASSKADAEEALINAGFPLIIVRAFPHTGPGQSPVYVLPALAARLRDAKRTGATTVQTGNLAAVRDFLDVRDVVLAYLLLLERGIPGEVYNVASGVGRRLSDCFAMLAGIVGVAATAAEDAALLRPGDIPVLIGDAGKLAADTGWSPQIPFERTLQDLVNAQAD